MKHGREVRGVAGGVSGGDGLAGESLPGDGLSESVSRGVPEGAGVAGGVSVGAIVAVDPADESVAGALDAGRAESFWQLGDPVEQALDVDLIGTDQGPWHRFRQRVKARHPVRRALRSGSAVLSRSWKPALNVFGAMVLLAVLAYGGLLIVSGLRGNANGLPLLGFGPASSHGNAASAAPRVVNAPSQSAAADDSGAAGVAGANGTLGSARPGTHGIGVPKGAVIANLVDDSWAQGIAQRGNIPLDYVKAYAGASIQAQHEYSDCGIGWNMLGGIGEVESDHGTKHEPGQLIRGPVLDGSNGTQAVPDSDGGILDGDTTWDRAVGPMQFLPSIWMRYGRDGDGDGVADPNDINDAALSAAGYLCTAGGNLTTSQGWTTAVDAYNHGNKYYIDVTNAANRLGAL
ncbi:MAG: lytic transglycosylase domain-containing protein [Bifidobacterium tibiigranuli]|uniref:lytic transglycosylase domain-containing protein n=1 Tax=Bifidobacterium tibiigranuli TaxID=2172043 RepID=UPI0026EBDFD2|nr:lytic transglycosylase domain-containing protein [Bifidobacterium tibiigranuli]MCI1674591.1 lytic transglycosylase domain-containing protein [Bifidobacterium tibiigranuli]MCI1713335.1 lytic transglycosylase domain-containing protein [Bifidobacterium tibiigranuli]MCI1834572.1 lytic transglycosylase domain-containing protein [Bifidobacterium tibiigranuli]